MRKIMKKWILFLLVLGLLTGCAGRKTPVASGSTPGESGSTQGESGSTQGETESSSGGTQPGISEEEPEGLIIESFGPDENAIVWVVRFDKYLQDEYSQMRTEKMKAAVDAVNRKLETDGKTYRLKVIAVRKTDVETLKQCGADIVKLDSYVGHDQEILDAGLMAPLDEWLPGSRLYDTAPEILWEQGRYLGSHYMIRDERYLPPPYSLQLNTKNVPDGFSGFDGDLYSLEQYLSPEHPLYYEGTQFAMVCAVGYTFDYLTGMVYKGEECINPLEDEAVLELLRTMNRWHKEGKLVCRSDSDNKENPLPQVVAKSSFVMSANVWGEGEWERVYNWKKYVGHQVVGSTGILASSEHKAEAFSLLEQIYADRDYANLLGMCTEPDYYFGLAVGIGDDPVFATLEERKHYFEENVLPSPAMYLDYPSEWKELLALETHYFDIDLNKEFEEEEDQEDSVQVFALEDFEEVLEEFRNALKEPMEKAIQEVNASRNRED